MEEIKKEKSKLNDKKKTDNSIKSKTAKKTKISDSEVIDLLKKEIKTLKEQRLIDLANLDNERKNYQKEYKEYKEYAVSSFIQNILPAFDMFSTVLSAKNVSDEIKNWLKGFEMIEQMFANEFKNAGVKKIEVKVGDKFNSKYHNAVEIKKMNDEEDQKILKILNTGYTINDRLLNPVNVVVSVNEKGNKDEKKQKNIKNKKEDK